jgi:hypothetical protein
MRRFPGVRLILGLVALAAAAFGLYRRNRRGGGYASADAARLQPSPGARPVPNPDLLCRLFPGRFCGHRVVAVGSVLKVRPTDQPAGAARAQLLAARNEFESFQIVVRAGRAALRGVSVSLSAPLSGAGGTIPPQNVTIYREAYYPVAVPSNTVPPADPRAATGPWPDALIPAVDPWFGQPRNAFPVDVPAGENRVAWVDVFVPPATPPGTYAGAITVTATRFSATVPIELTVFDATLPSTASLHSAFALGWDDVCRARYGGRGCFAAATEAEGWRLNALCARVALDNRVTISYPHYQPLQAGNVALFRQHVLPLLNGTAPTRLAGARLTAFQADAGPSLAAWRVEAQQQGFADRAFVYVCDEPGSDPAAWARCQQAATQARQAWPDVPVLVTASIQNATQAGATAYVNRLVVLANEMHDKPGQPNAGDQRAAYDPFVAAYPR